MSDAAFSNSPLSTGSSPTDSPELAEILGKLRRKEGSWVEWGKGCQHLQKAGYTPQAIFEATGFEPIQQNQIVVAMQVYEGIRSIGAPPEVLEHFGRKGSDILYEFRVLTQGERPLAAEWVLLKQLDVDDAREMARAAKYFAQLRSLPEGFTEHPGDAVAFQAWRLAQQTADLQERSRLIARALKFAHSSTARQKVELLLTDFSLVPRRPAPRLSVYRLESADELPRVLPVVGQLPLSKADLQSVPVITPTTPFRLVQFSGSGMWVGIPGWQTILAAEDPVVILYSAQQLTAIRDISVVLLDEQEMVLLVLDRADRQWQTDSYFVLEGRNGVEVDWFEEAPELPLLGRVLMIVRAPHILDEHLTKDPWQIDE
ncbi:MAG: RuBisCO accumulation factor 1 [Cyanobacteriota bacterium]|nr:RuBisCO accumulation factor 1 [Cyanobacteriota bacterium]